MPALSRRDRGKRGKAVKSRHVLQLLVAATFVLFAGTANAQTLYTLSVVAKGTFDLDRHYPKGSGVRTPFNFHRMLRTPQNGARINYFVFKPSRDVLKFMKSLSKSDLFSRLEPCSRGIDQALSSDHWRIDQAHFGSGRSVTILEETRTDPVRWLCVRRHRQQPSKLQMNLDTSGSQWRLRNSSFVCMWG